MDDNNNNRTHLEEIAEQLFGPMREATKQEMNSVNEYVRRISKNTDRQETFDDIFKREK